MQFIHSNIQEKSNPIGVLLLISTFLEKQGFDPQIIFDQFNIHQSDLQHKLTPISLNTYANIFKAAGEMTSCDHLGLVVGQNACLSNIGPLRLLVMNAETLRKGLSSLFNYSQMWYKGQTIKLIEEDHYSKISISIDCETVGAEQCQTAQLVAFVSIIELLLGQSWRPTLVRIAYPKPKSAHLYEKFFRCPVWFGQSQHEIIFPKELLDQKRIGHDDQLDSFLQDYFSELNQHEQGDIIVRVSKLIEELLPSQVCTCDKIAEYFSIHRFTLYRYLNERNTTFTDLLENVRKTTAIKLLKNKNLLLIEIANQIGYEDQANFTRAFKRWWGMTPGRWRRENVS